MDLFVFAVVFILVILAAFILAIWAVVREERRTQAAWSAHVPRPVTSTPGAVTPDLPAPTTGVASSPTTRTASASFAPSP